MKKVKGFTLVELLVVVAIIGILAAVAIPQFSKYRTKSYNATAKEDLRNLVSAEAAYYADHSGYYNYGCNNGTVSSTDDLGFVCSRNVVLSTSLLSSNTRWTGSAYNTRGDVTYKYDTLTSKIQE